MLFQLYQVITNIQVQQVPSDDFPNRNLKLTMTSLIRYDIASTWENLTQTLKLTLPKILNIKAETLEGKQYPLSQLNKAVGGYVGDAASDGKPVPTFLRGDIIAFNIGWRAKLTGKDGSEVTYMTGSSDPTGNYPTNLAAVPAQTGIPNLFQGFISKVSPQNKKKGSKIHTPHHGREQAGFTIECEDYMWLLKQVPTPNKQWAGKSLEQICKACIDAAYNNPEGSLLSTYKDLGITVQLGNTDATQLIFNVGNFWTRSEPLSQTLARVKSQYHLDSWFIGNTLYIGLTHYIPSLLKNNTFTFQQNIMDGAQLEFKRKDDMILSCIVRSYYAIETDKTTKDGHPITKSASTEILVYVQEGVFKYLSKKKGVEFPPNEQGKRFTFIIYDTITDEKKLFAIGKSYLQKYYYDGLTGSFDTFGIPYVKHGDSVTLKHPTLPEMNGVYMVRGVYPYGGSDDGLRQRIVLDYRVDIADNPVNDLIYQVTPPQLNVPLI